MSVGKEEIFPRHMMIYLSKKRNHGKISVEKHNTEKTNMDMSGISTNTHALTVKSKWLPITLEIG
jgi:hypothetical protein